MQTVMWRRRMLLGIVAIIFTMQVYNSSKKNWLKFNTKTVNIVSDGFAETKEPFCKLLPERIYGISFHLCTTDVWIEYLIKNEAPLDEHSVKLMQSSLGNYPRSVFLDIGSNMGIFSLAAAKRGHHVVAVDLVPQSIAVLHKNAVLNNIEDRITLINNAISDDHEIYHPALDWPGNDMATRAVAEKDKNTGKWQPLPERKQYSKRLAVDGNTSVKSVTLMDVLSTIQEATVIIKIDIEGFECKALDEYLLLPNKPKYIPYMYVEFEWIQKALARNSDCLQYRTFLQGFFDSGYEAYTPNRTSYEDLTKYAYLNVFWKHKTAKDVPYLEKLQLSSDLSF